ncbi:PEP/pyruvate-binding domain-containing protein [Methanococcoides methylutens]|uniref:PEP/pyruvate-binding domain-containing protein n=1 Tax=Methanococcoides methylutens TaxID=2226 RepID=UPI00064E2A5C|nr:PEP/pyruvate-binding domain-containing protein [Methanococcoides methylutens]
MDKRMASSGLVGLDELLQNLWYGDNVVWQVDELEDYIFFAEKFMENAIEEGHRCVYIRFAPHRPILEPTKGLDIVEVDPAKGFDYFSTEVHRIIESYGREVFYVFDNLSTLVVEWATDELLANFFKATCPYLYELDTVTYFALTKGRHGHQAVAAIRETTQLLLNFYHVESNAYIHPLKVYGRYSSQMFLPHLMQEDEWVPLFNSGEAASVSGGKDRHILDPGVSSIAPWDTIYSKALQYQMLYEEGRIPLQEMMALKSELCRMIIGDRPRFRELAEKYFDIDDLLYIRERIIGSGMIGGKSVGMLLSRNIVLKEDDTGEFGKIMEPHDSFYIGSDVFFTFLINNDLFRLKIDLSNGYRLSKEEFREVEQRFLEGTFPADIMEQFRSMLDYFGQAPIIVRSSSLLEDNFGNAFAGKYRSEFCTNQGDPEERLTAFLEAVKLVYASALDPDALIYRKVHGLDNTDEQMAILVQRVSGTHYKNYFFPALAGVTFSRNLFAWSEQIDPNKGMIRLVFGLGTRAVDRVDRDYPRIVSVSHPQLRPERGRQIARYSQIEVDLLDLERNEFRTVPVSTLLKDFDYPRLRMYTSLLKDDYLRDPVTNFISASDGKPVLTFNNLISKTKFVEIIGNAIQTIEKAYGQPVDVEFTAFIGKSNNIKLNILQCRPMKIPGKVESLSLPADLGPDEILFRSSKTICGGVVPDIRYIVYVDPVIYSTDIDFEKKQSLGRIIGHLNEKLGKEGEEFILMGPGRWGSSNLELGVNVTYSEIRNTSVLIEVARQTTEHRPDVSYGTHFFLDLVEEEIIYLPLYPDEPEAQFNERFFERSANSFSDILPEYDSFSDIIKLIDVPAVTGAHACVSADPEKQDAICFLKK